MATRLDHLRVERRGTEDPTDDRPVELEAVGDDQGTCCELHARRDVTNERQGVPVAASPDDSRRPETRPDLNRREHPRRPRLPPGERPDLVGLQLCGDEAGGPAVAKWRHTAAARSSQRATVFQASRSIRAIADRLTPSTRSVTTLSNVARPMLEAVLGRAFRRRARLSAPDAPVATPFPGCGSVESVADDACGLDVSVQRTRGVETAWFLHCAGLVDESTEALKCRPKL